MTTSALHRHGRDRWCKLCVSHLISEDGKCNKKDRTCGLYCGAQTSHPQPGVLWNHPGPLLCLFFQVAADSAALAPSWECWLMCYYILHEAAC